MFITRRLTLRPHEHIVIVIRRSPLAFVGPLVLGGGLLIVNALATALVLRWGGLGLIVYTLAYFLAGILLLRTWWLWYWTAFIVTTSRIIDIDQRGFLHRTIAEARFERIEDVAYEIRGLWSTLCRLGTLRVQTVGAASHIEIRSIAQPERAHELLGRLQELAGFGAKREGQGPSIPVAGHVPTDTLEDQLRTIRRELRRRKRKNPEV